MIDDRDASRVVPLEFDRRVPSFGESGASRRPASKVDLVRVCRRYALEEGTDLETMLWVTVKGLLSAASRGDARAAALAFEYLCQKEPTQVDLHVSQGPPVPAPAALAANAARLAELVVELELVPPYSRDAAADIPPATGAAEDILTELLG